MGALQTELLPIAFQLKGLDIRAKDYLRLKIAELALKPWCEKVKEAAQKKGVDYSSLHCRLDTPLQTLNVDEAQLTHLLVSSIVTLNRQLEAAELEGSTNIFVRMEDTQLRERRVVSPLLLCGFLDFLTPRLQG